MHTMKKMTVTKSHERGLTFIELIFVIAIFGIMTSLILFRFKDYGEKTRLDNLAQDIALHVVQAQREAISGTLSPQVLGLTSPSYGVYFDNDITGAKNTEFTYFTDLPTQNHIFDSASVACDPTFSGNECLSVTKITTGDYISNICYIDPSSSLPACSLPTNYVKANITFTRPFPSASIIIQYGPTAPPIDTESVFLEISSADGAILETMVVSSLGEVHVVNGSAECASEHTTAGC